MTKLAKNYYYGKGGEKKINCYLLNIPKRVVEQTNIKDDDNVIVKAENGKIVIEKQ